MGGLKDFATGTVLTAPTPATSGNSLVLNSGEGADMPATPFYATVHPPAVFPTVDNSEKVRVTAVSGDTLTLDRGVHGISAKAIEAGWRVSNTVFKRDIAPIKVTVATAAATAAKVGTSDIGNYVPEPGDILEVTFNSGSNVNSPTLNIDGGGAVPIRLGNVAASTALIGTTSALTIRLWYDGAAYQMFGSLKNDNTTYTEITDAESIATTSSTARLISGRRLEYFKNNSLIVDEDDMSSNTATKMPSQQSVKAYVDAAILATKQALYPVGSIYTNTSNSTNPATLLGFGTWVAVEGYALVGKTASGTFGTIGATPGAETHVHGSSQMAAAMYPFWNPNTMYIDLNTRTIPQSWVETSRVAANAGGSWNDGGFSEGGNTGIGIYGNTDSGSSVQPSLVVYMWQRTA